MLLEFPWGGPDGGRRRARNPGFTRSPHPAPRPPGPQQRPPAGSAPSAGATPRAAGSRPAGADSGFQRTFQVLGCGLAGRPRGGFPPGSRFLAAEGCAPAAAPLTPASSRRRPPRKGVLLRGIFQPGGPTSHPPTWRGTKRSEGPIYAAPPGPGPARGSAPGLPALVWALGSAEGLPLCLYPCDRPAVLTCPGGAHTEPHN